MNEVDDETQRVRYVSQAVIDDIEKRWIDRVCSRDMPITGTRYQRAECEFFCGAMTALTTTPQVQLPARWTIRLLSGSRVVEAARIKAVRAHAGG